MNNHSDVVVSIAADEPSPPPPPARLPDAAPPYARAGRWASVGLAWTAVVIGVWIADMAWRGGAPGLCLRTAVFTLATFTIAIWALMRARRADNLLDSPRLPLDAVAPTPEAIGVCAALAWALSAPWVGLLALRQPDFPRAAAWGLFGSAAVAALLAMRFAVAGPRQEPTAVAAEPPGETAAPDQGASAMTSDRADSD